MINRSFRRRIIISRADKRIRARPSSSFRRQLRGLNFQLGSLTTFAFRSSEVKRLLLDLDPYGGTDTLGMFPFLLRELLMLWPAHLSLVFRQLVRLGSFPACWRQANVTPIPKGPPSSSVANYRAISITSVLAMVFERLVLVRLGRFVERSGVLTTTQFA